mgnify:CR=1 FL=1
MQIEKKVNYTGILSDEKTFSDFYNSFLIENKKFQKENLIILISDNFTPSLEEFLLFLKFVSFTKHFSVNLLIQ